MSIFFKGIEIDLILWMTDISLFQRTKGYSKAEQDTIISMK